MEVETALWRLGLERERVYQGEGFSGSFSGLTSALAVSVRVGSYSWHGGF